MDREHFGWDAGPVHPLPSPLCELYQSPLKGEEAQATKFIRINPGNDLVQRQSI